ncbi:hypothetical protein Bca4012_003682 [Brassica carinata]
MSEEVSLGLHNSKRKEEHNEAEMDSGLKGTAEDVKTLTERPGLQLEDVFKSQRKRVIKRVWEAGCGLLALKHPAKWKKLSQAQVPKYNNKGRVINRITAVRMWFMLKAATRSKEESKGKKKPQFSVQVDMVLLLVPKEAGYLKPSPVNVVSSVNQIIIKVGLEAEPEVALRPRVNTNLDREMFVLYASCVGDTDTNVVSSLVDARVKRNDISLGGGSTNQGKCSSRCKCFWSKELKLDITCISLVLQWLENTRPQMPSFALWVPEFYVSAFLTVTQSEEIITEADGDHELK